jgi:hypothetical protein
VSRRGRPRGGQFAHPTQRGVELRPQFGVQLAGRGDDVQALACPRGMELTVELQRGDIVCCRCCGKRARIARM